MNTTILWEEIQWLLEAIREQYEVIRAYDDKIPQIELDILLDNVKKLYGKLHLVGRTNDPFTFADHKSHAAPPAVPAEPVPAPAPLSDAGKKKPNAQEEQSFTIQYDEGNESSGKTEIPVNGDLLQDLDLFNAGMTGFSGKLQEARQQSMAPKTRHTRPHDLKSMISINEKFLFINELFDGNLREYNENLEALCRFTDLKPAFEFLDILRKKNLWNSESVAFNRLKELLEERFS